MTQPTLLISKRIVTEFGPRLHDVFGAAPRSLQLLPFSPEVQFTADAIVRIEAAYDSRDIWEGSEKNALSPAARAFWNVIDRAHHLQSAA